MPESQLLSETKLALRITNTAYNAEVERLIAAARADLERVGVIAAPQQPLVKQAIITYCRMNFGSPSDFDKLRISYDEQIEKLKVSQRYQAW